MYTIFKKFGVSNYFYYYFIFINTFIQQGLSEVTDIYNGTKEFYFKQMLCFWMFYSFKYHQKIIII